MKGMNLMKSSIRNSLLVLVALFVVAAAGMVAAVLAEPAAAAELRPHGDWRVVYLDDRTIALTGDYTDFIRECYKAEWESTLQKWFQKPVPAWMMDSGVRYFGSETIGRHRPAIAGALQQFDRISVTDGKGKAVKIDKAGYWLNPTGAARFSDAEGRERITENADVAFFLFLQFAEALTPGAEYRIALPTGETVVYHYDPEKNASALFKINQLGYAPQAGRKYAYLGAWLGDAGPMSLANYLGKPFELCDAATGKPVFTGTVAARIPDPKTKTGTPFTGEETAELDFSGFSTPGRYYLRVAGIGRSEEFPVDGRSIAEAFYLHARGLYHKRCGIAKEKPYTNWTVPICHTVVLRGTFPPENGHYGAARKGQTRDFGFFDAAGNSIQVNHFKLIGQNPPPAGAEKLFLPGGWHDAADFDRRPFHLSIVGDLVAAYLIRPDNFSDGQLNIPESGNGIPDILDEARWGLEHLRLAQQPDGGVGTWIETDHHPWPNEYLPSSPQKPFLLSLATRGSSLHYAAYASMLSLALDRAGAKKEAELYRESARRAWEFAMNPANRRTQYYNYEIDKKKQTISYREPAALPEEFLFKAAGNLYLLYNDPKYLAPLEGKLDDFKAVARKSSWNWSPFFLFELELFGDRLPAELTAVRDFMRESLLREADRRLKEIDGNYPYRTSWYSPDDWRVSTMKWGTYHPLRRALHLLAAWVITGEKRYLDAAYLCNDFHNGANPNGMTMTSGLGYCYPARFLDLTSYADGIGEFVPGITPYRDTYFAEVSDARLAHGLYIDKRSSVGFKGLSQSMLPLSLTGGKPLTEAENRTLLGNTWPIWRRWSNLEGYSVPSSEYTVWETIAPAAVATGLLLDHAYPPEKEQLERVPVDDIRKLRGFAPLP